VVLDGWGDGRNQTVWRATGDQISLLASSTENDIGRLYKLATLHLGMRPDEHEYKVMGLAPYARPTYAERAFAAVADLCDVEGMRLVGRRRPGNLFSHLQHTWRAERFDNIAGGTQLFAERLIVKLFENIHAETGLRRFVLSGGVAMNIKANQRVAELPFVDEFFVCGSGADESLSIGACYGANAQHGNNAPLDHLHLGYDIAEDLASVDWSKEAAGLELRHGVTPDHVAALLNAGHVVARVDGRAEFGARALGNRSILAAPDRPEVVRRINEAIKQRDFWMPFAISILEEHADRHIKNPKRLMAPFMSVGFDTVGENYEQIRAGTHPYDRTVRPQLVAKETSPRYHALIEAFHRRTGIPALLNTSLNLHGEPIVNTVSDAISTLVRSGLTHLMLGDTLITKPGAAP
jgi:carbamoyltransferase